MAALRTDDTSKLFKILGSGADEVLSSGDEVADAQSTAEFLQKYDEQHQLVPGPNGEDSRILEVGYNNWPMPIPIVQGADGWRFDTAAGLEEMLNRRIGRNELDTIETCRALNDAQAEYFAENPTGSPTLEYARKFISSEGTRDGLYWPTGDGEPMSPLGGLVAEALAAGYVDTAEPQPYLGYRYRILTAQGGFAPGGSMSYLTNGRLTEGFAIVAYPAKYGNSGVMTFIMNQQGIVYQRDLGPDTASVAATMAMFDPDPGWTLVE